MKIRIMILEKDISYLNRIVSVFNTKYADQLEIYSFTDQGMAVGTLKNERVDVFLSSDAFQIETAMLPSKCGFAYFVESPDMETLRGEKAICKFQRADQIYKQILGIYSEKAEHISSVKAGKNRSPVIVFASPGGGSGSSTMAAAFALRNGKNGKRVLYLNLENFGSADVFFSGEGRFDMSDVIFALKSRKTNLAIKLESCVKQDPRGVCFFSQPKVALDRLETKPEEIVRMISSLQIAGTYELIVVDMDFSLKPDMLESYGLADSIVWTGDGTKISNQKIERAWESLVLMEQRTDVIISDRIVLLYNRFNNNSCHTLKMDGLRVIGGAPRYKGVTVEQLTERLSDMAIFDHIMER